MSGYSIPAILIRRIDYGDNDLIITFFTRDFGKTSAIAKSAKKSVKRFRGVLELFSLLLRKCAATLCCIATHAIIVAHLGVVNVLNRLIHNHARLVLRPWPQIQRKLNALLVGGQVVRDHDLDGPVRV